MKSMIDILSEINHYLTYCEKHKNLSVYTLKAYRIDLAQYVKFTNHCSLDRSSLEQYICYLHENFKPKTIKRKIASLKAFTHYLYCADAIDNNPFDKIDVSFKEPLRLPRTIPPHLIKNILSVAYKNISSAVTISKKYYAIRNAAVLELLFATGARISEICSLRPKDIDLVSKTVKIFGKGSRERIIQIENKDVLKILKNYQSIFAEDISTAGFFFLNNRKSRLSEQSVRTIIRNLEQQINSEIHITPHMFRHSVATMLLEEDVDIRYIQRILGHSSITTTQIYTHVTSSKQKEILRTKHPRNKIFIE